MPSDPRTQQALAALAAPRAAFRSAVAVAVEQVGAFLDAHRVPSNGGRVNRVAHELGAFAADRIDAGRFAATFVGHGSADPLAVARIERAYDTLRYLDSRGDAAFVVRVRPGGDLRAHVANALADIGRVFSAARAVGKARTGRYTAEQCDERENGFAFREWSRAERQIAPPLVVEVEGADVQAGGLAEFLDGTLKIVLVVRGDAPAAPLVRLVTPGVFVMQTADAAELDRLADVPGPGIAALVPEIAARFASVPGDAPAWQRLDVRSIPGSEPRAAIGSFGVFQQVDEWNLLRSLTAPPSPDMRDGSTGTESAGTVPLPSLAAGTPEGADPQAADRLAAWLTLQAGLGVPAPAPAPAPAPGAAAAPADPVDKLAVWLLGRTDLSGS